MFSRFRHKPDSDLYAGISLHDDGARAALMRALPDGRVALEQLSQVQGGAPRAQQIGTLLEELDPDIASLTAILANDDYSLLQIEPPQLPADEINDALRWRIQDMIDFPAEGAVMEHFMLPQSQRAGAARLAYVIAARPDPVGEIVEATRRRHLRAIDVPEMALRDLVMHALDDRIYAYLYLSQGTALIEICRNDEIRLSREVEIRDTLFDGTEQTPGAMDELLLEVQRSLDYYQSLYACAPVDGLQVLSTSSSVEAAFVLSATVYLSVAVQPFDLSAIEGLDRFDDKTWRQALLAMGAAIREMPCAA